MTAVLDRPAPRTTSRTVTAFDRQPEPRPEAVRTRRPAPRRRRWWLASAAALLAVALVALGAWRLWPRPAPPMASGPRGPEAVSALGYLEPKSEVIRLSAPTTVDGARVQHLLVSEGDEIAVGTVVAILDNHDRRQAALAEATARVDVEKARLETIKAGAKPGDIAAQEAAVGRARATVRNAEANYGRVEKLARTARTPYDLDQARLALDSAREDLRQAEATLESLREVREVDIRQQESQIAAAQAAVATARADLEAAEIRTPIAGRVLKVSARPGERVGDAGIAEIGDVSEMFAVAEVYEADLPKVQIGRPATVRLFTGEGATLHGEVAEVGLLVGKKDVLESDPVADTDARVVEVRIRLNPEDGRRVAGLSNARVEVEIEAAPTESRGR